MIVKILTSQKSCMGAINYSEKKVDKGEAALIDYGNLPSDSYWSIKRTFDSYEHNPAIRNLNANTVLHLAVNPDPDDDITCSEDLLKDYVFALLDGMGYTGQPYVVYKHDDIGRTHYHVVSPRVREDGKMIRSNYDAVKLLQLNRKLGKQYGFTVGNEGKAINKSIVFSPAPVSITDTNRAERVLADFEETLKYNITSYQQFLSMMAAFNIHVRTVTQKKNGEKGLWMQILNERKAVGSMGFLAETRLKVHAYQRVQKRIEKSTGQKPQPHFSWRMQAVLEYAGNKANTWEEFFKMLDECRFRMIMPQGKNPLVVMDLTDHRVWNEKQLPPAVAISSFIEKGWPQGEKVERQMLSQDELYAIRRRMIKLSDGRLREKTAQSIRLRR